MGDHTLPGGYRKLEIVLFSEIGEDGRSFSSL
jgi:hypothetical protein